MLFPRNWLCVDCLEWNGILSYSCCYIGGFVITSYPKTIFILTPCLNAVKASEPFRLERDWKDWSRLKYK